MQSLLGVDLFGTHGDDMKQISDKKEHQTQARIRGEYENREGPWRGDKEGLGWRDSVRARRKLFV